MDAVKIIYHLHKNRGLWLDLSLVSTVMHNGRQKTIHVCLGEHLLTKGMLFEDSEIWRCLKIVHDFIYCMKATHKLIILHLHCISDYSVIFLLLFLCSSFILKNEILYVLSFEKPNPLFFFVSSLNRHFFSPTQTILEKCAWGSFWFFFLKPGEKSEQGTGMRSWNMTVLLLLYVHTKAFKRELMGLWFMGKWAATDLFEMVELGRSFRKHMCCFEWCWLPFLNTFWVF